MTQITVSLSGLEAVIAQYQGMPRQIQSATTRTIRKTVGWVVTQARRDLASEMGVAQSIMRKRLSTKVSGDKGIVWFGLNPFRISKKQFPSLRQTKQGTETKDLTFPGSFVAKMPNGVIGSFYRIRRARLPIAMDLIPFGGVPAVRQIIAAQARKAAAHAAEVLAAELNYEINVKGVR